MIGQTISHYRITQKLGEGGMGVVYKAEDTKLKRPVALKFLAAHLLKDEEARKRFDREARAAAALHHPNVCPVYEIGEANGQTFLAMAFIEGESLDKKIEQGPLKIPEALDIAQQIAKGLDAAHKKKIVHRDIKPGNVIVDDKGHATVMDFGLALLTEGSKLTQLDITVGTVAYMSPEQAEGAEVDRRTDIWALGCVIYEMVCGQRAFKGQYDQVLLYEIVHEEPEPLTGQRTAVPVELELLVTKCLAKNRENRYQTASELIVDLRTLAEKLKSGRSAVLTKERVRDAAPLPEEKAASSGAGAQRAVPMAWLPWGVAAMFAAAFAVMTFFQLAEPSPPERAVRRFSFTPENLAAPLFRDQGVHGRASISPNGKHIVYLAGKEERALYVRDMDRAQPRKLEGTEGAIDRALFWSPDSRFIGFATGNEIKKIAVAGGSAISLCPITDYRFTGASWRPDGSAVVFSHGIPAGIFEVSDQGGEPELLFDREVTETGPSNFFPVYLPGKRRVILFTVGTISNWEVAVKDLETGDFSVLVSGAYPIYSSTGHILYQTNVHEGGLWALPFAIETLKPTGDPFRIVENVADASLAADGTLVAVDFVGTGKQQLVWLDREGRMLGAIGQPQEAMLSPSLSPDGRRVAVQAEEGGRLDIWLHDTARPVKTRLTFDPASDAEPLWSVSGEEIFFASNRSGNYDLFRRAADGSGEPKSLVATPQIEFPSSFSSDETYLLYRLYDAETASDIWYLERKEQGSGFESRPLLQGPFDERYPQLSPDPDEPEPKGIA